MKYLKSGGAYVIRIDKGEEVIQKLEEFSKLAGEPSFSFTGIGASDRLIVGAYDLEKKLYHKREFNGQFEIDSLIGNLSIDQDKPFIHAHITFSGEDMAVLGGHLNECFISGTCEVTAVSFGGKVSRKYDELTGLWIFDIA